jgi:uncharacterized membrane protein
MAPSHVAFPAIGAALIALGLPLARRWVRPNRWYGLRMPATLADETVWFDANAASGRELIALGIVLLAVAVLAQRPLDLPELGYVAVCLAVLVVGGLGVARRGMRLAERLRRERGGGASGARPHL